MGWCCPTRSPSLECLCCAGNGRKYRVPTAAQGIRGCPQFMSCWERGGPSIRSWNVPKKRSRARSSCCSECRGTCTGSGNTSENRLDSVTNRIFSKARGHDGRRGRSPAPAESDDTQNEGRGRPSLHWTKSIPLRETRAYCGRPPPTSFTRNFTVPISCPAASARQLNSLIWSVFFGGVVNSTSIGKISPGEG